jgi:hypothetical protein
MKNIKVLGVLVFLSLFGSVAHASKLPDFKHSGVTVTGNSAKIGMTGNGGPEWGSTIPISPTAGGWSYAGNYGIPQAAKGTTMTMGGSGHVFFSGTKYPFQVGYTSPASNVFAGLKTAAEVAGGALGGPIGLALIVGSLSAPYIKQWFDESDLRVKPDGSGIQKGDPNYCATNCYRWRGNIYIPWQATPTLACQAWVAVNANRSFISVQAVQESAGRWSCTSRYGNEPNTMTFELVRESRAPDLVKSWFDIPSLSDISPYMTPRPFDPRVIPEILDRGGDIPMPSPTITGPSSLPGPQQVIKNPDGTTTTINTTNNYQIAGDTITNISNVTSTTITNSSSTIISTSTSTVTPSSTDKNQDVCASNPNSMMCQPVGTATDTPFGPIPNLYTPIYPNGIVGVWNSRKAELTATPLANTLTGLMPTVDSSGTCPSFTIPLDFSIANYGTGDFSPPCWIWDFGKVVIVVSSLLLARALVFGG